MATELGKLLNISLDTDIATQEELLSGISSIVGLDSDTASTLTLNGLKKQDEALSSKLSSVNESLSNYVHLSGDETLSGDLYKSTKIPNKMFESSWIAARTSTWSDYDEEKHGFIVGTESFGSMLDRAFHSEDSSINYLSGYGRFLRDEEQWPKMLQDLNESLTEVKEQIYDGEWNVYEDHSEKATSFGISDGDDNVYLIGTIICIGPAQLPQEILDMPLSTYLTRCWNILNGDSDPDGLTAYFEVRTFAGVNEQETDVIYFTSPYSQEYASYVDFEELLNNVDNYLQSSPYSDLRDFLTNTYEYSVKDRFALTSEVNATTSEISSTLSALNSDFTNLKSKALTAETDPKFKTWKDDYHTIILGHGAATPNTTNLTALGGAIAIGWNAKNYSYPSGAGGVAIGYNSIISGTAGVAIGQAAAATFGITIGYGARGYEYNDPSASNDSNNIVMGNWARIKQFGVHDSILIAMPKLENPSAGATISASNAIQLGWGRNAEESCFNVFDYKMLDPDGNIPIERLSAVNIKVSNDKKLAIGSDSHYSIAGKSVCYGLSSNGGNNGVAVGISAIAGGWYYGTPRNCIAIGTEATASADNAIQLGTGFNNEASSFQVYNYKLLDSNGNIPEARVSAIGYSKDKVLNEAGNISANLVVTSSISSQAVTNDKIANWSIQEAKYGTSSISTRALKDRAVTPEKLDREYLPLSGGTITGDITISKYALSSDLYILSSEMTVGLSNIVLPKLDTISALTKEETEKLDELSGKLTGYVPLSDYQALELRVAALESRLNS